MIEKLVSAPSRNSGIHKNTISLYLSPHSKISCKKIPALMLKANYRQTLRRLLLPDKILFFFSCNVGTKILKGRVYFKGTF